VLELGPASKQAFSFQAQVFLTADNDVVQDIYTHNLSGFSQSFCQLYVIF